MKLYDFDGIDVTLPLVPLAARRALDRIGAKLSLEGFLSLPLGQRTALTTAGSGAMVDEMAAQHAILGASPAPTPCDVLEEPSADRPPSEVTAAYGSSRPLDEKLWQSLSPLDRYALAKVAGRGKEDRIAAAYDEIVGSSVVSTHVRPQGGVHMVSIADKAVTTRSATAECWVSMSEQAFGRLLSQTGPKGDVLATARLAGIMATKKTADIIPLCHPLPLEHAEVDFTPVASISKVRVTCTVRVTAKTGVEMEAMVGANVAALTVYDMLKSVDRSMEIGPCRLLEKSGGRSGSFVREDSP